MRLADIKKWVNERVNYKNVAYILILFLAVLLSMIFGEINNSDSTNSFGSNMGWAATICFYIGILLVYSVAYFIAIRNRLIDFKNWWTRAFFIVAGVVLIYMTLVVSCMSYSDFSPIKVEFINALDRVKSIMDVSLSIIMVFSFVYLIPNFKEKDLAIRIFCYIYLAFTLVTIIYSLATEIDVYGEILSDPTFITKSSSDNDYSSVRSWFYYQNVFGHVLFLACFVVLLLSFSYKKKRIVLFILIFALFIFVSSSRTALIGYILFRVVYIVYFFCSYFNKNRKVFYIGMGIIAALLILVILETFVFNFITVSEDLTTGETVTYTVKDVLIKMFDLYSQRIGLFTDVVDYGYSAVHYIFGLGYNINDLVIRKCLGDFNFHVGYLEIYTYGGIFLVLVYLFMTGFLVYKVIKLPKENRDYIWYMIICAVPYLIYQFSEAFVPFANVFGGGIIAVILVAVPYIKSKTKTVNFEYLFIEKPELADSTTE